MNETGPKNKGIVFRSPEEMAELKRNAYKGRYPTSHKPPTARFKSTGIIHPTTRLFREEVNRNLPAYLMGASAHPTVSVEPTTIKLPSPDLKADRSQKPQSG